MKTSKPSLRRIRQMQMKRAKRRRVEPLVMRAEVDDEERLLNTPEARAELQRALLQDPIEPSFSEKLKLKKSVRTKFNPSNEATQGFRRSSDVAGEVCALRGEWWVAFITGDYALARRIHVVIQRKADEKEALQPLVDKHIEEHNKWQREAFPEMYQPGGCNYRPSVLPPQ